MTNTSALQRLLTWLSPAFPVGAFAYSAGLESAIAENRVTDSETMQNWLEGSLAAGAARNDALFVAAAHRAHEDASELATVAELCTALLPARQRLAESLAMGNAFVEAAGAWPNPVLDRLPHECPYPVAIGAVAAANDIGRADCVTAFLTAYAQSQISVGIRLIPLGQTDGLAIQAALEPLIAETASAAATSSLSELGGIGYGADIASMAHETLRTRIFRS